MELHTDSSRAAPDRVARDEHRRRQREYFATHSDLLELKRKELRIGKFGLVQHLPSGDEFFVYRGAIETGPAHPVAAFYRAADGSIHFLERVGGGR